MDVTYAAEYTSVSGSSVSGIISRSQTRTPQDPQSKNDATLLADVTTQAL